MASRIAYKTSVEGDLSRLDRKEGRRILDRFERALGADPRAGVPLSGEFRGLFKFRVVDYRVIFTRTPDGILVLRIAHRQEAYR